jgi:hypothetical protein
VPSIDRFVWLMPFCGTGSGCLNGINRVRRNAPDSNMFDASGYAVLKQTPPATGTRFDPYYLQFGRPAAGGSPIH